MSRPLLTRSALALLAGVLVFAFVLPLLLHLDGVSQDRSLPFSPPGAAHWLGTDGFGRDQLARLVLGTRLSLLAGFLATALALAIGVVFVACLVVIGLKGLDRAAVTKSLLG